MTLKYFSGYAAILGITLPLLVMLSDSLSAQGWWPSWIFAVWPSSFMLIATAGTKDLAAYAILAISVAINAIFYGVVGAALRKAFR